MSVTVGFVLFVLGCLALVFRKKRAAATLILAGGISFYVFGSGVFTPLFLSHLQPYPYLLEPSWKAKNAIVVLGAGTVRWSSQPDVISIPTWANARITEAARLYQSCRKANVLCAILATGGDPGHHNVSEAQVISDQLIALGVDPKDIIREDKSRNTFQNAKFSAPILLEAHYDRIFLVTSGFHLRRAKMLFDFFGIETVPSPADRLEAIPAPIPVSFNFIFSDLALHEFLGIMQFHTYNFMGWN